VVAHGGRPARPARTADDPDGRAVVVGPMRLWPQLLWPEVDEHRWVTAERDRLPCTFFGLRAAGFERLVVLGPAVDDLVGVAETQGWRPLAGPNGRFTRLVGAEQASTPTAPTCPAAPGG